MPESYYFDIACITESITTMIAVKIIIPFLTTAFIWGRAEVERPEPSLDS